MVGQTGAFGVGGLYVDEKKRKALRPKYASNLIDGETSPAES
jgi:hypothetical protein